MNALKVYGLFLAVAGMSWLSCNKEVYPIHSEGSPVSVTFAGRITGDDGTPLTGAVLTAGNATAATDANGVFRLDPVTLPAHNAILNVRFEGYFDFSRAYFVEDNAVQQVDIQLLKKKLVHTFPADQSAIAEAGAARISFPANSVTNADGSAYSGTVRVLAQYLEPVDAGLSRQMPGDLRGVAAGGEDPTLATFGMIAVELTTPNGDPLQIAAGKDVELTIPIPVEKLADAPAEIPMWYYDVEKARWIEEGRGQKTGDQYVGHVKHFSFWNFDVAWPSVYLEGQAFVGNNTNPLSEALVRLTSLSKGWTGYGYTNENGFFGGPVPKDEAIHLDIFVEDQCGFIPVYTETIGPFSQDISLPAIIVPASNFEMLHISGRLVDCNAQPVNNGYILASTGSYTKVIFTDANGIFDQNMARCFQDSDLNIIGFDPAAQKQSDQITFSNPSSPLQTGDIPACNIQEESATVVFNGQTYIFKAPFQTSYDDTFKTAIGGHNADASLLLLFAGFGKTGTFPIYFLSISDASGAVLSAHAGTTVVTQYGKTGEFISGTLSGTAPGANGQVYPFSGSFQVLRDQ